jgi:hypothetical protein
MGAFSIAFDIIIVGALALPWVLLVIHVFFSANESSLKKLLDWVKDQNQPAVAGVLLFAMTYSLGSAVSRIAQDFFDDDDLHIQVSNYLLQVGVTETSIRTDVFCNTLKPETVAAKPSDPLTEKREPSKTTDLKPSDPLAEKREQFRKTDPDCKYTGRWIVPKPDEWIDNQEKLVGDVFPIQEAAVLLQGTDKNERLRQFHDQIMVLRGAAFSGLIAFSLCLFWWSTNLRSTLRWAVPSVYLFPGLIALYHHLRERSASDPPYMEFTLLVLAAAGWCLLWQHRLKQRRVPGELGVLNGRRKIRAAHLVLSFFLTATAFLGWWATQVLYDQTVIYSYQALIEGPAKPVTPK